MSTPKDIKVVHIKKPKKDLEVVCEKSILTFKPAYHILFAPDIYDEFDNYTLENLYENLHSLFGIKQKRENPITADRSFNAFVEFYKLVEGVNDTHEKHNKMIITYFAHTIPLIYLVLQRVTFHEENILLKMFEEINKIDLAKRHKYNIIFINYSLLIVRDFLPQNKSELSNLKVIPNQITEQEVLDFIKNNGHPKINNILDQSKHIDTYQQFLDEDK